MEQKNNEQTPSTELSRQLDTTTIRRIFDEKIAELSAKTQPPTSLSERVAECEFKIGRLWKLLTTEDQFTGNVKKSKEGKKWSDVIRNKAN
jgi:hypothetical protein